MAVTTLNIATEGWTVVLDDAGILTDGSGLDYIFDLVSEMEVCPAFPISGSSLFKGGARNASPVEVDHHITTNSIARPQVRS